jgi:aspartate-semialdehyde dehydrogenase
MDNKIKVGILGATGMVGQTYIMLLAEHPWFEITYLAASPKSAGLKYSDAIHGRWHQQTPVPNAVAQISVCDANIVESAVGQCSVVFSAIDLSKKDVAELELKYAKKGFAVISVNSAHRFTEDVPMVIPEVNPEHLGIIPFQQKSHGWEKGFIVVKSNCSIQSYVTPMYALIKAGYKIDKAAVTTLQALSGAGYPGPSAFDIIDNIVPFIKGEEEKSELEPLKVFGNIDGNKIVAEKIPTIAAHCNRVPVIHGHTACVNISFLGNKPSKEEIISIWKKFTAIPQKLCLPSAPENPIIYTDLEDRPQPRFDRDLDKGMAITVGRLRPCNVFDYRFVGLHHNTIRGAAGGSVLTAELLKANGYL